MSDSELWKDYRNKSREKRNDNLQKTRELLIKNKVVMEEKENGHFIINAGAFDFWGTTGLYINRKTGKRGRGVFSLLKEIEKK